MVDGYLIIEGDCIVAGLKETERFMADLIFKTMPKRWVRWYRTELYQACGIRKKAAITHTQPKDRVCPNGNRGQAWSDYK